MTGQDLKNAMQEALQEIINIPEDAVSGVIARMQEDERESSLFGAMGFDGEAFAVRQMLHFLRHPTDAFPQSKMIPSNPGDTIKCEYSVRVGRADIVVFHVDGSVSVIEVKDGATGYRAVVAGIGQATLYACQIGLTPGSVTCVRRVLAWSSTGKPEEDRLLGEACKSAGVIPVRLFTKKKLHAAFIQMLVDRTDGWVKQVAMDSGCDSFIKLIASTNESVRFLLDLLKSRD